MIVSKLESTIHRIHMSYSIHERYAQAIRSTNLSCVGHTTYSDLDVIAAMAFADAKLSRRDTWGRSRPGAVSIARLVAGDDGETHRAVRSVALRVYNKARFDGLECEWAAAESIAKACIAWMEHGGCRVCAGSMVLRATCAHCNGTGRISFIKHFTSEQFQLAKWAIQEIVADLRVAGAEAVRALNDEELSA